MVALGLVILVLAVLLTLGIVFSNGDPASLSVFGLGVSGLSVGTLFLVGLITGVLGALGLTLFLGGGLRNRHKRVAAKREVKTAHSEAESLAEENARLARELEQQRGGEPYPSEDGGRSSRRSGLRR